MSTIAIRFFTVLLGVCACGAYVVAGPSDAAGSGGSILLVGETAPSSQTENAAPDEGAQERYLATQTMETCMNSWDPGTHMTKEAWRASCERIKEERLPYVQKR
jgi:hypothetical protein